MQIAKIIAVAAIAARAKQRKSLTDKGIACAVLIGLCNALHPSWLPLTLLISFYILGTSATKYKGANKSEITISIGNDGHQRNHLQVLANSLFGTILAVMHTLIYSDLELNVLMVGIIAHWTAALGDTLSSEIGILSKSDPYHILTLKRTPRGVNGGVSLLGLEAAAIGGGIIGLVTWFYISSSLWRVLALSIISALSGTLIDSILGALFQQTLADKETGKVLESQGGDKIEVKNAVELGGAPLLDNNGVNLLMTTLNSCLYMLLAIVIT